MPSSELQEPVLTVGQLTNAIKHCLEDTFPTLWVQGEISNFKLQSSGHLYFSLKDNDAQISAVMFRASAATLSHPPKDGDKVIIFGELNVYPPSGKYQILVKSMRYQGIGELLLKLEELKRKLHARGWFKKEHKKALPKLPKTIGVVTSPTGAAIQDILNVLTRRFSGFHMILNPVKVQGEGAAQEIAQAIKFFNDHRLADVIIIGRGGGSIEDLWAFNEEIVAEAIFNSEIPIIGAVGHETDHTIAEYVADIRAPTPSAAAEMVIAEQAAQNLHLQQITERIKTALRHQIIQGKHRLEGLARHPSIRSPSASLLGIRMQQLDGIKDDIDDAMKQMLSNGRLRLTSYKQQIEALKPHTLIMHWKDKLCYYERHINSISKQIITAKQQHLRHITATLEAINPKNILKKGFSIAIDSASGNVIKSASEVNIGQEYKLFVADGELLSEIKEINHYD